MRLLNAKTFKFKEFNDAQLPPYAILSHTWGSEEVSYKEIRFVQQIVTLPDHLRKNEIALTALTVAAGIESDQTQSDWRKTFTNRAGLKKILGTAKLASEKQLDWVWLDTCCIDKRYLRDRARRSIQKHRPAELTECQQQQCGTSRSHQLDV